MLEEAIAVRTAEAGYRVYPDVVDQRAEYPCVYYDVVSRPSWQGLTQRFSKTTARVQIDVYGLTLKTAEKAAEDVLALWRGFTGEVAGVIICGSVMVEDSYAIDFEMDSKRKLTHIRFETYIDYDNS